MNFMIIFQNKTISFIELIILLSLLIGCKNIGKEFSEKIIKESTEESSEVITKKITKNSLRELGEKSIKNLDYDDFILLLKRDFPVIYASFSKLDKSFQKDILENINKNPKVLDALLSSKTLLDEFIVATANIPSFAMSGSYFSYYVMHPQFALDIILKQKDDIIELFSKSNNRVLGRYKDGLLDVIDPFAKDGHSFSNHILKGDLIPNTLYRVKGPMGIMYKLQTDDVGNVVTAQCQNIIPEDLITNILRRNSDINLGSHWLSSYKKLKQYSNGADLNVVLKFNYTGINPNPRSIKIIAKKGDKEIVNEIFENINHLLPIKYSSAQNLSLVKGLKNKLDIPADKMVTLLNLMDADGGFAAFIHSNPEFNIKRWLKTRNHVDERLISRTPQGRFPPNSKVYAGNVYYFNPYLNPGLANRLSNKNGMAILKKAGILSREQLEELDRLYPNGVPFSKRGFPDFSGVSAKDSYGKPIVVDIGKLSGDSKVDIAKAETIFQSQGNKWEEGFTWHHIEGTSSLLRVPSIIHQLIDHAGGIAMSK